MTGRQTSTYARHPDDWYVEPAWTVDALLYVERPFIGRVMDPCCGAGTIPNAFRHAATHPADIVGTDIVGRSESTTEIGSYAEMLPKWRPDSVVSNPPYRQAQDFIEYALSNSTDRVCALLPLNFFGSEKRRIFFASQPLARLWVLTPRVSMLPGDMKPKGSGTKEYAWFVFEHGHKGACLVNHLSRNDTKIPDKGSFSNKALL